MRKNQTKGIIRAWAVMGALLLLCSATSAQSVVRHRWDTVCQGAVGVRTFMDTLLYEGFENGLPSCWTSIAGLGNNGIDAASRMYLRGSNSDYFLPYNGDKAAFESDAGLSRNVWSSLITPSVKIIAPDATTISFHFLVPATSFMEINDYYDGYNNEYHDTTITNVYDECALAYALDNSGNHFTPYFWHINYSSEGLQNYRYWTYATATLSGSPSGDIHYIFRHNDEGSAGFGLDEVLIYGPRQIAIPSVITYGDVGSVYTSYDTVRNNGDDCREIIVTHWYIRPPDTTNTTIATCDEYLWDATNETYNSSGVYTKNYTTSEGCDSVALLTLTINHRDTMPPQITEACDSFYWAPTDNFYTTSTSIETNLTNRFGCDSLVYLNLSIKHSSINTPIDTSVCDSLVWDMWGYGEQEVYRANSILHHTLHNAEGCDSVLSINVNIHHASATRISTTGHYCDSYTWYFNNKVYSETGTYLDTLPNQYGCDSIGELHLTMSPCPSQPLPDNIDDPHCTTTPPENAFNMQELYHCNRVNAMSTPMIGDVDGDGVSEIVACRYMVHSCFESVSTGFLVFDGRNGALKYTLEVPTYSISGQCMSIFDADRNGRAELYLIAEDNYLYSFEIMTGTQLWRSAERLDARYLVMSADVNSDGRAEVVCGPYIFDAISGTLLLHGQLQPNGRGHGSYPNCWGRVWYMQALADIDYDGQLEFAAANTIYKPVITNTSGTAGNTWSVLRQLETNENIPMLDGQTFIVDFDNDGDGDVCVIGAGSGRVDVYVWEGQSSELIGHYGFASGSTWGGGMTPSIPFSGDLDGNGTPEIIFNLYDGMRAFTFDNDEPHKIRQMHYAPRFGETAGFTVFDFNQDGREEIVYRNVSMMYIVDGTTLADLCPALNVSSGTVVEYPTVADVTGDGHAEIIVCRNFDGSGGVVSVYSSQTQGAWGSARKVWNQWAYNSVCINEDLSVPRQQFDVTTLFPNGKRPFNGFLRQMPRLNRNGDIYLTAPDMNASVSNATITYSDDGASIIFEGCNNGENTLYSPIPATLFSQDTIEHKLDTLIWQRDLTPNQCDSGHFFIPMNRLCHIKGDSLYVSLNDSGDGPSLLGGLQAECNLHNNRIAIPFNPIRPKGDTVITTVCDNYTWPANNQTYTKSIIVDDTILDHMGCDSVQYLDLTVYYSHSFDTVDTICDNQPLTFMGQQLNETGDYEYHISTTHLCDSTVILHLKVFPSYKIYISDSIRQKDLPYIAYFNNEEYNYEVRNEKTRYDAVWNCDSIYYLSLYIGYTRLQCDRVLLFPNLVTPNGDGINDFFEIKGLSNDCYPSNHLIIYNRWGNVVFQQHDIHSNADTWHPTDEPRGTYYFHFRGRGTNSTIERNGVIELIRE